MSSAFGMLRFMSLLAFSILALGAGPALSQEFTFDAKANEKMAKKLQIPVFFAVPESAYAPLPKLTKTSDRLLAFKHPDANGSNVGLRLFVANRSGLSKRLAKSGLVQTGDLLLTFRAEWGGAGAYPNIQMGISHTGIAYVKDGVVHNLDNPMDQVYLGPRLNGDLTSEHYRTLNLIHVIRPRGLTDQQRANILGWATRLGGSASKVYPSQIKFNTDYNAPKYKSGRPVDFVKQLGQIALGQNPPGTIDLYCSEFAWSLLALKDCVPKTSGDAFKTSGIPACVKQPMQPMEAVGTYVGSRNKSSNAGLADGPLLVVDALKLPDAKRRAVLQSVFDENPERASKMSIGHQQMSKSVQSNFAYLRSYYVTAISDNVLTRSSARVRGAFIRSIVTVNYSPTSFLVNTLLPPDNTNRTMDYVATILIE